jgi:hypothetical protein
MLVFNPSGNLALAHAALLQSLVDAIEGTGDASAVDTAAQIGGSVPYALTARLAREHVRRLVGERGLQYQFKLSLVSSVDATRTDVVISEVDPC